MPTDYSVGDRDHWVEVARKRGQIIARLIRENESMAEDVNEQDERIAELEGEVERLSKRPKK